MPTHSLFPNDDIFLIIRFFENTIVCNSKVPILLHTKVSTFSATVNQKLWNYYGEKVIKTNVTNTYLQFFLVSSSFCTACLKVCLGNVLVSREYSKLFTQVQSLILTFLQLLLQTTQLRGFLVTGFSQLINLHHHHHHYHNYNHLCLITSW